MYALPVLVPMTRTALSYMRSTLKIIVENASLSMQSPGSGGRL